MAGVGGAAVVVVADDVFAFAGLIAAGVFLGAGVAVVAVIAVGFVDAGARVWVAAGVVGADVVVGTRLGAAADAFAAVRIHLIDTSDRVA